MADTIQLGKKKKGITMVGETTTTQNKKTPNPFAQTATQGTPPPGMMKDPKGGVSFVPIGSKGEGTGGANPTQPKSSPVLIPTPQPEKTEIAETIKLENKETKFASISEQMEKPIAKTLVATAGVLAGTLAVLTGVGLVTGAFGLGTTAATTSTIGGTVMYRTTTGAITGVTSQIATNSATAATTTSLLSKMGTTTAVAGTIMAVIGTYPFAGFIKEESLQTLSMAANSAMMKKDWDNADKALAAQEEILNPSVWDKIINAVPFVNVVTQLKDFYKSAKLKTEIDRELINQQRIQEQTGETDADMWARIREENLVRQEEARKADEEYYAQIAENQKLAKENQRAEDAKFWAKIAADKDAKMKANREAEEAYWAEVRKEWAKQKENSAPSNLKFGLL